MDRKGIGGRPPHADTSAEERRAWRNERNVRNAAKRRNWKAKRLRQRADMPDRPEWAIVDAKGQPLLTGTLVEIAAKLGVELD